MNNIKLSSINSKVFDSTSTSDSAKMTYLAKSIKSIYEASYYAAKAMGFKNVSEMEQALHPDRS